MQIFDIQNFVCKSWWQSLYKAPLCKPLRAKICNVSNVSKARALYYACKCKYLYIIRLSKVFINRHKTNFCFVRAQLLKRRIKKESNTKTRSFTQKAELLFPYKAIAALCKRFAKRTKVYFISRIEAQNSMNKAYKIQSICKLCDADPRFALQRLL